MPLENTCRAQQRRKWSVGDKVHHAQFGIGVIESIKGAGAKITLIVKFANLVGKSRVLDPWLAPIKPLENKSKILSL